MEEFLLLFWMGLLYGTALPRSVSRTGSYTHNLRGISKAAGKIRGWWVGNWKKRFSTWRGFLFQHVYLHDAICKVFQLIAAGRFPELLTTCEELENCWDNEMTLKCRVNTFVWWFWRFLFVFISIWEDNSGWLSVKKLRSFCNHKLERDLKHV